jgi:hypothetical protein
MTIQVPILSEPLRIFLCGAGECALIAAVELFSGVEILI